VHCIREHRQNGNGEVRVRVAQFIAHMRQESEPQPLEIKIVNAREVGTGDRVLAVKRDDTGKMTGAVCSR
jgi:hypothetical protein